MGGALFKKGAEEKAITGINVTPLVDITLVLLIIFIVTAKLIVLPAVPLDLPKAGAKEGVAVVLSVIIPPHNAPLLLNGESINDEQRFSQVVKEVVTQDPTVRALLSADGRTPHARVVQVLDLLNRAGVSRIAFAVQ